MGFAEAKKILVFSYFSSSRKQSQIKPETTGECTPSKQAAIKLIKKKKITLQGEMGGGGILANTRISQVIPKNYGVQKTPFSCHY